MCTGRIDLSFLLRAFSKGMDGVIVIGCRLNECNYITHGNFHALGMVHLCKKLMEHLGLNPDRLKIEFMSGGEGVLFVEVMNDFSRQIHALGPLGKSEGIDGQGLNASLDAAAKIVPYIRLVERERLRMPFKSKEEFESFFNSTEFKRLFNELIVDKLAISRIASLLQNNPLPTGKIAEVLGMTPSEVSQYMKSSSRQGLLRYDEGMKCFALA